MEEFVEALRELRLKRDIDYAIVTKHGKNRLFCAEVFREDILQTSKAYFIEFVSICTWPI